MPVELRRSAKRCEGPPLALVATIVMAASLLACVGRTRLGLLSTGDAALDGWAARGGASADGAQASGGAGGRAQDAAVGTGGATILEGRGRRYRGQCLPAGRARQHRRDDDQTGRAGRRPMAAQAPVASTAEERAAIPTSCRPRPSQPAESHTCLLTTKGSVRCWGSNIWTVSSATARRRSRSTQTGDVLTDVAAVAVGDSHTCALTSSGGVRCWGFNLYGQLGDGSTTNRSTPPTSDVLTGVAGHRGRLCTHLCALDHGGVRCWGSLGGAKVTRPPANDFLTGVQAIAAGGQHTCAVMATGGLRCWGANYGPVSSATARPPTAGKRRPTMS